VVRLVVASLNISDIILHSACPSLAEQQENSPAVVSTKGLLHAAKLGFHFDVGLVADPGERRHSLG
jgi:hypothetical protein